MPVLVHHPVRVLAVGGPVAGVLHHQDLGLDVEGGVALGAPGDLEAERDHGGPEQGDQEGDYPHRPPAPRAGGRRRGRVRSSGTSNPAGCGRAGWFPAPAVWATTAMMAVATAYGPTAIWAHWR